VGVFFSGPLWSNLQGIILVLPPAPGPGGRWIPLYKRHPGFAGCAPSSTRVRIPERNSLMVTGQALRGDTGDLVTGPGNISRVLEAGPMD
jgi:hypothetical protein